MTQLAEIMDVDLLKSMVEGGFIRERRHPGAPYTIYNYAEKAAFANVWNEATLQCRGLIVHDNGTIIARPFKKFFNLGQGEYGVPPDNDWYRVFDKMDGSLGICYVLPDGTPAIATRGSFGSDQAEHATAVLRTRYHGWVPEEGLTYLFEIIYPANRIVVDYKNMDDLVLLGVQETAGGGAWLDPSWPGPMVDSITWADIESLPNRDDREGYVLYWPLEDFRLKVKHPEYVRLHRLLTNVTARTLWDLLRNGQEKEIDEVMYSVPDEFYDWVQKTVRVLKSDHNRVEYVARREFQQIAESVDAHYGIDRTDHEWRKSFAIRTAGRPNQSLYFMLLDKRDMTDAIWKMLKPAHDVPFKENE